MMGISAMTIPRPNGRSWALKPVERRPVGRVEGGEASGNRDFLSARDVQRGLLPHSRRESETIDCVGLYRPAQVLAGDYYDFLDVASGCTAFLVADVSGKGLPAALLMAHLQACFRVRTAGENCSLPTVIGTVNGCFYRSSLPEYYATVFIGGYDEAAGRLHYANCGHCPPLLLRAGGELEWLHSTATVIGLFPEIACESADAAFEPGDTLVVYSDGISEVETNDGDCFGTERLAETVELLGGLPVPQLAEAIMRRALDFSRGEQQDDMTLVVARVKTPSERS